jgi:AraC-like DNA-binding protein
MPPSSNPAHATGIEVERPIASSVSNRAERTSALIHVLRDTRLRKVIQMIESEAIGTVHALAVEVNLSCSQLQHLFKRQTGVCITQLLTEKKLRKAAHHLEVSDMSVKEIAHAVGYEHASSFIRAFQRYFAQTPREYRLHSGQ